MSTSNGSKLSVRVVINKKKSKVLFAEANSDVVDVLLSFLTLPLGKIVRILENHYGDNAPVFGSLTTLYGGLVNLNSTNFCSEGAKQMLLNPATSFQLDCCRLKIDISDSQPRKVYHCEDLTCRNPIASNVSLYSDIAKCACGEPLNREVPIKNVQFNDGGVFMFKGGTFVISDDLRIVPVGPDFLQTLNDLSVTDTDGAEMRILGIDIGDVLDFFVFSLVSSNPLTDLVIKKTQKKSFSTTRPSPSCFLHQIHKGDANSRKMTLKVFLQKSTNMFLLAVATDEFVEFLFSFLALPLGGVEYLLGGKTCSNSIDNLYRSITEDIHAKFFASPDAKNRLTNPKLPYGYIFKNQILPLIEETAPKFFRYSTPLLFKPRKGEASFLKEQTMYAVRDDLTVTPFSMTSSISILDSLGISLSDVKARDVQIGVEEGLSILKASLTSTTPLTDALIKPMLKEVPKRRKLQQ